jgi:hypothetical protein
MGAAMMLVPPRPGVQHLDGALVTAAEYVARVVGIEGQKALSPPADARQLAVADAAATVSSRLAIETDVLSCCAA